MAVMTSENEFSFENSNSAGARKSDSDNILEPIEPIQAEDCFFENTTIYISIHFENGKFGASIYENKELKMLKKDNEIIDHDLMDMISLKDSKLKYISSTLSNIKAIKQCLSNNSTLQLVPATDFSFCNASSLQESFGIMTPHECASDNEACFRSLKALLIHLSKILPDTKLVGTVSFLQIDSSNVAINKICMQALQIFDHEPHPNMHAAQSGFKEGCSIFSLFNQVLSEEGRSKLKNWFQNPTNNIKILKNRHDSIAVLLKTELTAFIKSVSKSLKKCIKLSNVLTDLKFRPSPTELLKIGKFCEAFHEIYTQTQDPNIITFPVIDVIKTFNFAPIFNLSRLIRRIINTERFKESEIYTVRELINSDLDSLRRKYSNLPDFLTSVVSEIAQGIKSHEVEAVNIVYFPQLGFLITLPLPSIDIDPIQLGVQLGFQLQFQSEKICYFKNEKMRNLDENIGDVYADIIDVQLEIMQQVVNETVSCEPLLIEALEICSELDCLIAFSKTAQMHELNRPEMTEDSSVLQIEDGRHLLVEMFTNNSCIANDCNLTPDHCKMILTGANSSGKSVYLKQVGIIAFLAHIGSFVPARAAKIGLVDRIVTRIRTIESSEKGESCFMIDLKQVKGICENITDRSLILIDEFGKGTCQNNGMALFSGLLSYFSNKKVRLLAITHMYEVFRNNLIPNSTSIFTFAHMKVFPDKSGLCYLYRLEEGLGLEQSFAIDCARESGINEEILVKAKHIHNELVNGASPEDLLFSNTNDEELSIAIDIIKNSIVHYIFAL